MEAGKGSKEGEAKRMRSRPLSVTIAAVLLGLLSLANIVSVVMPSPEGVPAFVVYSGVVLGVAGLIGSAGLWMLKRWSLWLTNIVCVLNILSAAPGLFFAPNFTWRILAAVGVVGFALVILLAVQPEARRSYS
jgi:peptidoglycan/LPS O-acetylase OafA/YrhL